MLIAQLHVGTRARVRVCVCVHAYVCVHVSVCLCVPVSVSVSVSIFVCFPQHFACGRIKEEISSSIPMSPILDVV